MSSTAEIISLVREAATTRNNEIAACLLSGLESIAIDGRWPNAVSIVSEANPCIENCTVLHLAILLGDVETSIAVLEWLKQQDGILSIVNKQAKWRKLGASGCGTVLHACMYPSDRTTFTGNAALISSVLQLEGLDIRATNEMGVEAFLLLVLNTSNNKQKTSELQIQALRLFSTQPCFVDIMNLRTDTDGTILVHSLLNSTLPETFQELCHLGAEYFSEDTLCHWDCYGQCALYWAGQKFDNEEDCIARLRALLDIPNFPLMKQLRSMMSREPPNYGNPDYLTMCRLPLTGNIHIGRKTFLEIVVTHQHFDPSFLDEIDSVGETESDTKTLVEHAIERGKIDCLSILYKAGAKATLSQLIPTFTGPTKITDFTDELCNHVRKIFLEDFANSNVVEVLEVNCNSASTVVSLGRRFQAEIQRMERAHGEETPATRFLWHASSCPDVVQAQGANNNFSSMDMNVYGVGIYFATDAKLSAAYSLPNNEGVYSLLLVLTILGTTGVREPLIAEQEESLSYEELKKSMDSLGVNLKQPQHRNPPIGCDSSTGPHYKEVVITNSAATFPVFEVKYRVLNAALLPNPYQCDTESRQGGSSQEYLRPLQKVACLLRPESEGLLDIVEDAKLLPMGTFPVTRKDARDLKEKVKSGRWSVPASVNADSPTELLWSRCLELSNENSWLKEQLGELQLVEAENQALRAKLGI